MDTRRITRSRGDRMVAGVAGGLAVYFNIDPIIVRLIFLGLSMLNGLGLLIYGALWAVTPNEDATGDQRDNLQVAAGELRDLVERLAAQVRAAFSR